MKHCFQKALFLIAATASIFSLASCDKMGGSESNPEVKVYLTYTLSTSNGEPMPSPTKARNDDVWQEFYSKISSGDMVAPSYELVFTESKTGNVYNVTGKWADHSYVTLRTGQYHVTGVSTSEGDNIQDKCSISFNDLITIDVDNTTIILKGQYDCGLIVFNDPTISELSNYNGNTSKNFFSYGNYKYAFFKPSLYSSDKKNEAYLQGKRTDNSIFKVYTGNLSFESGKYYVYNNIAANFQIDKMIDGRGENGGSSASDGYVTITYNISSTGLSTIAYNTSSFSAMSVDGSAEESPATKYSFSTSGKHTISWKLKDPNTIGEDAFYECSLITNAVLSNTIQTIGVLTDHHKGCFQKCSNLTACNMPTSMVTIGVSTWDGTALTGSVVLPSSVKTVGHYAFQNTPITEFTFGEGVTTTSMCMFQGCKNLKVIYALPTQCPPNEYMWKNYSFYDITKNGVLHYPKGCNYSKWLQTSSYWLGYYGWTGIADL